MTSSNSTFTVANRYLHNASPLKNPAAASGNQNFTQKIALLDSSIALQSCTSFSLYPATRAVPYSRLLGSCAALCVLEHGIWNHALTPSRRAAFAHLICIPHRRAPLGRPAIVAYCRTCYPFALTSVLSTLRVVPLLLMGNLSLSIP